MFTHSWPFTENQTLFLVKFIISSSACKHLLSASQLLRVQPKMDSGKITSRKPHQEKATLHRQRSNRQFSAQGQSQESQSMFCHHSSRSVMRNSLLYKKPPFIVHICLTLYIKPLRRRFCSVAVIMSALHTESPGFNPLQNQASLTCNSIPVKPKWV